ncbi:PAS domain-containing protein [soil metagenome]
MIPSQNIIQSAEAAHLASIVECSSDAIISGSLEGIVTTWNAGATSLLGYCAVDFIGQPIARLVPSAHQAEHADLMARLKSGQSLPPSERVWKHRDGYGMEVSVSLAALRDEAGSVVGFAAIAREAPPRRKASEDEYRLLFQHNPHPMWVYDAETLRFLAVNSAAMIHYGYSEREFLAMTIRDIRPEEDLAELEEVISTIRSGRNESRVWRHQKKSGEVIEVEVSSDGIIFQGRPGRLVLAEDITERRHAAQALEASEKEFRTLAEAMPQIVWISVPGLGNIYSNQRWMDYTGQTPEESRGNGWSAAYHPDDRPCAMAAWKLAGEQGSTYAVECRLRRRDGVYRWWLSRAIPQIDEHGKIVKWFGTSTDIDDLKQAEAELKEKEALLLITGRTAKLGGWTLDIPSYHLVWTEEIYRIFELSPDTPLDVEKAIELYAPESRGAITQAVEACSTLGTPYDLELEIVTARGRRRWARSLGQAERDSTGRIWRIHGAFQDITDRRIADEALRLSAQRLQMAAKAGRMGVWDLDLETMEISCDEQMLKLYGLSQADHRQQARWHERVHPDDRPRTVLEFEEALREGGKPLDTEFRVIRGDNGSLRSLRGMATVVRDQAGKPVRMIGLNWDITEQRIREEKLADSLVHERELARQAQAGERAKSEFLAVMSHEIRTPMNGILGFAEILSGEPSLSEESKGYVQTISGSGEALLRILDDILDFSRIDADRVMIEKKVFNPRDLVRDIEALFTHQLRDKGVEFHVAVAADVPELLQGDAGRIRQILVNLAGNALKFTDQGTIAILMSPRGELMEFLVRDTGAGIPAHKLAAIFEPFTQADSANSRRKGGTGLGLTISRRLAELMGGRIEVQSEPEQGSVFSLVIPLESVDNPGHLGDLGHAILLDGDFATQHPLKVLVVEDDRVNLKLILTMVAKLGYEPLMALNGVEAVDVFQREQPDCILMDVQMPEMDGIEATRKIREMEACLGRRAAYISALTANIVPEDQRRCFEAGINFYLNKPVKSRAIADVLIEACVHREKIASANGGA